MRIDLDHICLAAKGTPLLRDVCASVPHGAFVSILGESGAGKTTLLRVVSGLAAHDAGHVLFNGQPVDDLPANRRGIAMVFQDARLFPNMSVLDNVAFPLKVRGTGRAARRDQAARMLEKVQLAGLSERRTHEISGGQRQRVALARALVAAPGAVLMDEPFSALDESLRDDMRELVLALHAELGLTVLMVTHDPVEAVTMSDQVIHMAGGAVEQSGTGADILLRPATAHVRSCFKDTVAIEGVVEAGEGGEAGAGETGADGLRGSDEDDGAVAQGSTCKNGCVDGLRGSVDAHEPAHTSVPRIFRARKLSVPTDAPCGAALLVRTRAGATSVKPLETDCEDTRCPR